MCFIGRCNLSSFVVNNIGVNRGHHKIISTLLVIPGFPKQIPLYSISLVLRPHTTLIFPTSFLNLITLPYISLRFKKIIGNTHSFFPAFLEKLLTFPAFKCQALLTCPRPQTVCLIEDSALSISHLLSFLLSLPLSCLSLLDPSHFFTSYPFFASHLLFVPLKSWSVLPIPLGVAEPYGILLCHCLT